MNLQDLCERIVRDAIPTTDSGATCFVPRYQIDQLREALSAPQPPAEAQAQGGGEVVAWVSRHDAMFTDAGNWRYTNPVLCSSQESPDMIPLCTAPPSAPVGVDKPLPVFSAGTWTYSETGQAFSAADLDQAAFVAYRDHLAQQPAAVGGVVDFEIHAGGEYFASVGGPRERAWNEAMHYVSTLSPDDGEPEVFEVTRRKVSLAAQPGGSDND